MYTAEFLRIGKIGGMFYKVPERKTKRLTIYGLGAPLPPDNGSLPDAKTILQFETDLYVPDYIGYGRSAGIFTPRNTIQTFLDLYDAFTNGCSATCGYQNVKRELQYSEIHFIGRSFGGAYVPLLPRYNSQVINICAIFPVSNWKTVGTMQPEETIEGFYRSMKEDGYKYLYRGILQKKWRRHFSGQDGLSLIENIKYLKHANLFIGHGRKDVNINYQHTKIYFRKIQEMFPEKKDRYLLKIYPYDHSSKTSQRVIRDYFLFKKVPRVQ